MWNAFANLVAKKRDLAKKDYVLLPPTLHPAVGTLNGRQWQVNFSTILLPCHDDQQGCKWWLSSQQGIWHCIK